MGYPSDFSGYGYRINKELGANRAGGRVTYLATDLKTLEKVVIKQFQFAKAGASWSEYDAYRREIDVLRGLKHPGIPSYLNCFQTENGFCMVQEYKHALSLATHRSFSLRDVRQIAIALLEILAYLQNRIPPIIHRDIKPENILVDDQINVYLVDFGFARVGDGEVGVSSVVKGTLGFMPPEQLFNRQLTEASDLYGLGMTLICLLTGTRSTEIGDLVDISYRIDFKHLIPKANIHWVNWLEKMVEPRHKDRFPNATTALAAIPKELIYLPEARFSDSKLQFIAKRLREKLTQTVTIDNHIPETLLQGKWQVAAHPNDPYKTADSHSWITFHPAAFEDNHISCQITVDTGRLMAGKTYQRNIVLQTNSANRSYTLSLQVQTAPPQIRAKVLPYGLLGLLFLFSLMAVWVFTWIVIMATSSPSVVTVLSCVIGASLGLELTAWMLSTSGAPVGATTGGFAGAIVGLVALFMVLTMSFTGSITSVAAGAAIGLIVGITLGISAGVFSENLARRGINKTYVVSISLLTTAFATVLGVGFTIGFSYPIVTLLLSTSLPWTAVTVYLPLNRIKLISEYRESERRLIKPDSNR